MQVSFGANWRISAPRESDAQKIAENLPKGTTQLEKTEFGYDVIFSTPDTPDKDKQALNVAKDKFVTPAPRTGKPEVDEKVKPKYAAQYYYIQQARLD